MVSKIKYILFLQLLLYVAASPGYAQQKPEDSPKPTRILFILDASGSMAEKWGTGNRLSSAKKVLTDFVDSLKQVSHLEIALRIYGHQFDKRFSNCKDTKLEVPFGPKNHDQIKSKIRNLDAKGVTPIAYSLMEATKDFPQGDNVRNVIVLITDGIESCGGDPCQLSLEFQKKKIFLRPFIVGLGGEEDWNKAFDCMGKYINASDEGKFRSILSEIIVQTMGETKVKVKILDSYDKPKETNVNMTFVNSFTGEAVYDFVHFLDSRGETDYLKIDPLLTYDLVIQTIPKVEKKNILLEGGKENIIEVKAPTGYLMVKDDFKEYKQLKVIVRESNKVETLFTQNAGVKERYLTGTYEVEILTLPRTRFYNVQVRQNETTTLNIHPPGILNISEQIEGYGSIYEIKSNGEQVLIYNMENDNSKVILAMQPGNYKFVFRSKKSIGSAFTDSQLFTIRSGATTNLKLFARQ